MLANHGRGIEKARVRAKTQERSTQIAEHRGQVEQIGVAVVWWIGAHSHNLDPAHDRCVTAPVESHTRGESWKAARRRDAVEREIQVLIADSFRVAIDDTARTNDPVTTSQGKRQLERRHRQSRPDVGALRRPALGLDVAVALDVWLG